MAMSSYLSNKQKKSEAELKSEWQVAYTMPLSLPRYWKTLLYIQFHHSLAWEWRNWQTVALNLSSDRFLPVWLARTTVSATTITLVTPIIQSPTYVLLRVRCRFSPTLNRHEASPTLSDEELKGFSKACVPKNTESSTKWALENFKSWMSDRNSRSKEKCPESLLEDMDPTLLDKWLSAFIAETRKVNGDPYPPTSLHLLLSGLQCHMRSITGKEHRISLPRIIHRSKHCIAQWTQCTKSWEQMV